MAEDDIVARVDIEAMLQRIDEPERRLLHMHYQEQLGGHEIGADLGVSDGAARFRLHTALKRLRIIANDARDELRKQVLATLTSFAVR